MTTLEETIARLKADQTADAVPKKDAAEVKAFIAKQPKPKTMKRETRPTSYVKVIGCFDCDGVNEATTFVAVGHIRYRLCEECARKRA